MPNKYIYITILQFMINIYFQLMAFKYCQKCKNERTSNVKNCQNGSGTVVEALFVHLKQKFGDKEKIIDITEKFDFDFGFQFRVARLNDIQSHPGIMT